MVVEHAHGLRQRRGPNAKSSLHKAHLAPDAGLQAPGASLSFAQGSHDFESLDRGIDRKSTRLNSSTNAHLVCRLLLEKKKKYKKEQQINNQSMITHNTINRTMTYQCRYYD